jgi:hypothetical protein
MAAHRVTNVAIQQSLEQSKKKIKKKKHFGANVNGSTGRLPSFYS